jgi:hypothetical protein
MRFGILLAIFVERLRRHFKACPTKRIVRCRNVFVFTGFPSHEEDIF